MLVGIYGGIHPTPSPADGFLPRKIISFAIGVFSSVFSSEPLSQVGNPGGERFPLPGDEFLPRPGEEADATPGGESRRGAIGLPSSKIQAGKLPACITCTSAGSGETNHRG